VSVNEANMVIRETVVLTPAQLREDIEHPEKVRLKLSDDVRVGAVDIGSLAFSKRRFTSVSKEAADPIPVVPSSFRRERVDMLVALFDYLSSAKYQDSSRWAYFKDFKSVIDACDQFGCADFMESPKKCRHAYKSLSNEWRHQMKLEAMSDSKASLWQGAFRTLIRLSFGKDEAAFIVERINPITNQRNRTKPPEELHFKTYIQTAIALARQLKSFVVEEKKFPIKLVMPEYQAFVFQSHGGNVKTPYTTKHHGIYNFEQGRLATFDEWKDTVKQGEQAQYDKSVSNFEAVNNNMRHERRIDFATLSMQAYMKIFILLTGAQPSEVRQLEYSESLEFVKDKFSNDFRAIKLRAQGREVSYNLGDRYGYLLFKEYLQLRKWVLGGEDCKHLFFHVIAASKGYCFNPIKSGNFYNFISRIRGKYVSKDFGDITSSPTRKFKNLILAQLKISLETRASVLNHTEETNVSDYTETTPERQAKEFQAHWNAVKKAREHVDLTGKHSKKITTGHCVEEGVPEAEIDNPPIEPDCKSQYGCLFCSKYSCHADEEDAHKLYSLLFVIDTVRNESTDFNHAEKTFQTLSIRINEILKSLGEKSEAHQGMLDKVKKKVMVSGILTPFWERRLDQYERMGVTAGV